MNVLGAVFCNFLVSPVCLSSGGVVNQYHLHKETGSEARVVMTDTHTCQRAKVMTLYEQTNQYSVS